MERGRESGCTCAEAPSKTPSTAAAGSKWFSETGFKVFASGRVMLRAAGCQSSSAASGGTAGQFFRRRATSGNGRPTFGNGRQTFGNGRPTFGNGRPTSGNGRATFGNGRLTFGNGRLTFGNGGRTLDFRGGTFRNGGKTSPFCPEKALLGKKCLFHAAFLVPRLAARPRKAAPA